MELKTILKRYPVFILGLYFLSLGIVLIVRSALGTTPISSINYVLSINSALSLGTWTFLFNLLLIAGQEDPVGDFGRGVREVYDRYLASGHTVQLKLYPGCRHELLNELDRDEVTADLIAFFDSLTHID